MADFDNKTYYLSHKKFQYLYLIYIPLFGQTFLTDPALSQVDALVITLITVGICVFLSDWAFTKYVRKITAITLATDGLETAHASGKRHVIPYDKLVGPIEQNFVIIKKFSFRHSEQPLNSIIVTSLTDQYKELLAETKRRIEHA